MVGRETDGVVGTWIVDNTGVDAAAYAVVIDNAHLGVSTFRIALTTN